MYKVIFATVDEQVSGKPAGDVIVWFYEKPSLAEIRSVWTECHHAIFHKSRWCNPSRANITHV
jgi:hypothetical protein